MGRKFDVGEGSSFGVLPEDVYAVRVQKCEITTIKNGDNKGTEGYLITFEVASEDKYNGRLLWDRLWFLPQNGWTWVRTLSALIPSQEWTGEVDIPDCYDLVGLKCMVSVIESSYTDTASGQTKEKNEIKDYMPMASGSSTFSGGFGDEPF